MNINKIQPTGNWNAKMLTPNSAEFHVGWINYLDKNNEWKPIDCNFRDEGTHFIVDQAPFTLICPKKANGKVIWTLNNRADIFDKKTIEDAPFDLEVEAITAQPVDGVIEKDMIVYPNAFPDIGADLIYYVQHGRAPRLRKLVRWNVKPDNTTDIRVPFRIKHPINSEIKRWNKVRIDGKRDRHIEWDKKTLITQKGLSFRPDKLNPTTKRGARIKDPRIWDSRVFVDYVPKTEESVNTDWNNLNWQPITVEIKQEDAEHIIFTKIAPKEFFDKDLSYPVYMDTTGTFYPDHNPESTSVDGWVAHNYGANSGVSWTTIVGVTGNTFNDSGSSGDQHAVYWIDDTTNLWYYLARGIFLFDTSSIGSGQQIDSAIFSVKIERLTIEGGTNTPNLNVYSSAPASDTALAGGDFDSVGSTEFSTSIAWADLTDEAYEDFTLNASGENAIAMEGITKFSTRNANHDVADSAPTWGAQHNQSIIDCYMADTTDITSDPKLAVTWSVATSAFTPRVMFIN